MKKISIFCLALLIVLAAGCLAAGAETITVTEWCGNCGLKQVFEFTGEYFPINATQHQGWYRCKICGAGFLKDAAATTGNHTGGTATCSEKAKCTLCGAEYGDYADHDWEHHDAQAASCTEVGWDAYDACKNCGEKKNYKEIPVLDHDTVSYDAKEATCTEIGWEAYETCRNCAYTTYKEIPALEHDYQLEKVVKPSCTSKGYSLYACTRCTDTCTKDTTKKLLHWYGEWTPDGNGAHGATCRREDCEHHGKTACQMAEFKMDGEEMHFCPVCGEVENGERLERIEDAKAEAMTEVLPQGEAIVRMNGGYMTLAFEYAGKITTPTGQVRFTMPAEPMERAKLMLMAQDGTESELAFEVNDGEISFVVDFTDAENPVMLVRLATEA